MFRTVVLLLVITTQTVLGQSTASRAVIYSRINQGGDYIIIPQTYAPDLREQNFDNLANSVCVTGLWIFYVNNNYNTGAPSGIEYVFGENAYCTNFLTVAGYISSARFAGSPNNYKEDTFTLYQDDYFQGVEEYMYTDLPTLNLAGDHKSIIITGTSAWTVFDQENFGGNSICLFPEPSADLKPLLITDVAQIEIPYGSIKSVSKGCIDKTGEEFGGQVPSDNHVAEFSRFGQA